MCESRLAPHPIIVWVVDPGLQERQGVPILGPHELPRLRHRDLVVMVYGLAQELIAKRLGKRGEEVGPNLRCVGETERSRQVPLRRGARPDPLRRCV